MSCTETFDGFFWSKSTEVEEGINKREKKIVRFYRVRLESLDLGNKT